VFAGISPTVAVVYQDGVRLGEEATQLFIQAEVSQSRTQKVSVSQIKAYCHSVPVG
jgi:hypothetical protein